MSVSGPPFWGGVGSYDPDQPRSQEQSAFDRDRDRERAAELAAGDERIRELSLDEKNRKNEEKESRWGGWRQLWEASHAVTSDSDVSYLPEWDAVRGIQDERKAQETLFGVLDNQDMGDDGDEFASAIAGAWKWRWS